jgi:hypothetical protein
LEFVLLYQRFLELPLLRFPPPINEFPYFSTFIYLFFFFTVSSRSRVGLSWLLFPFGIPEVSVSTGIMQK